MAQINNTPEFDTVEWLIGAKLRDEHRARYSIGEERRWMNLPVEKSNGDNAVGLCRFHAFSDTYQGTSQLNECRRSEISKHYIGGKVGEKISINQLQDMKAGDIFDILKIVRQNGVTTRSEYEDGGDRLLGKTRHTVSDQITIEPHDMDLLEKTLEKQPLYVSFQGNEDQMQIIEVEGRLFRRYQTDEDGDIVMGFHAVMGIGYGYCINDDDENDVVRYIVGQNNWSQRTAQICRFSYESFRFAVGFDIGPSS